MKAIRYALFVASWVSIVSAVSCASDDDGTGSPKSGDSEAFGGTCEDYLACAAVALPDSLPALEASLGPEGTCWEDPAADCESTCLTGLLDLQASSSDAACWPGDELFVAGTWEVIEADGEGGSACTNAFLGAQVEITGTEEFTIEGDLGPYDCTETVGLEFTCGDLIWGMFTNRTLMILSLYESICGPTDLTLSLSPGG